MGGGRRAIDDVRIVGVEEDLVWLERSKEIELGKKGGDKEIKNIGYLIRRRH